jgi:hypothetical protein
MLPYDPNAVRQNVREATNEDLLDRVTAYREGMEPEAVAMIEGELAQRGFGRADIERHEDEQCRRVILRPEGFAYKCSFCRRPAVQRQWGWHWIWGLLPILPCILNYCDRHAPAVPEPPAENDA